MGQPRTPSTTSIFKFLLEELAGEHRELQTLFVAAVMKGPPLPSPIGVGKRTLLPSTPPPSASRAIPEGTSLLLALFCSQVSIDACSPGRAHEERRVQFGGEWAQTIRLKVFSSMVRKPVVRCTFK